MNKEVLEILEKVYYIKTPLYDGLLEPYVLQINQLFEPSWVTEMRNNPEVLAKIEESMKAIKEGRVKPWSQVKQELGIEPKPDESRLLTDEEIHKAGWVNAEFEDTSEGVVCNERYDLWKILKAQDAKTASIIRERIEKIIPVGTPDGDMYYKSEVLQALKEGEIR